MENKDLFRLWIDILFDTQTFGSVYLPNVSNRFSIKKKWVPVSSPIEHRKKCVECRLAKLMRLSGFECATSARTVTFHAPW